VPLCDATSADPAGWLGYGIRGALDEVIWGSAGIYTSYEPFLGPRRILAFLGLRRILAVSCCHDPPGAIDVALCGICHGI
jgi:hypothetical protein